MSQPEFESVKASLSRNQLFEDPDFPAVPETLAVRERGSYVTWLRPWDIAERCRLEKPMFVVEGAKRFDLYQGQIGDCWFVAAAACLAFAPDQLFQRVVPLDQSFDHNYSGIFRFHFWHFGRWVDIFVDDRLPTISNRLVYARNDTEPHEFWVPLLEKAYAKLNGGYDNIGIGGHTCNAMVDFTGGISEAIDLRQRRTSPGDLFDVMCAMMKCSMMSCSIRSDTVAETELSNGLYTGHAYSITSVTAVELKRKKGTVCLLRLRNPWGKGEWNGSWSDRSSEWRDVSDKTKEEIGMQRKIEGEFWMSFEDFLKEFDRLWVCHLEPDTVAEEIFSTNDRTVWKSTKFMSEWIRGYNAGGCGNRPYQNLFWRNPQFSVTIPDDTRVTDVVVSLMQQSVRSDQFYSIGFMIYKVRDRAARLLDGENYDRRELRLKQTPDLFTNLREVTEHSQLEPGQYVIIPCTFNINEQTKFILRVFTETAIHSEELDDMDRVSAGPQVEDSWSTVFDTYAHGASKMDAKEVTQALNAVFRTNNQNELTLDASRNVIDMFSTDGSCLVSREEFQAIIKQLSDWKNKFELYDKDSSSTVDTYELSELFRSIGIQLSRRVMSSIVCRYGGKEKRLRFADFVLTACRINVMYQCFVQAKNSQTDRLDISLKEFLAATV